MCGRRKRGKKEKKRQRIIEVSQRIDERWVALLDDMVQGKPGSIVLLQPSGIADFSTSKGSSDLFRECFLITKFIEQRLVEEILDIFRVVKGRIRRGSFGGLFLIPGFAREDSYADVNQNTLW